MSSPCGDMSFDVFDNRQKTNLDIKNFRPGDNSRVRFAPELGILSLDGGLDSVSASRWPSSRRSA